MTKYWVSSLVFTPGDPISDLKDGKDLLYFSKLIYDSLRKAERR